MEDSTILISQLNDFIFCPASIYFHNLYGDRDNLLPALSTCQTIRYGYAKNDEKDIIIV